MSQSKKTSEDIPLPLALVLLGAVLILIFAGPKLKTLDSLSGEIERFVNQHGALVMVSALSLILNTFSLHAYAVKYWSYRKQGSRLRELTGGRQDGAKAVAFSLAQFVRTYLLYAGLIWLTPIVLNLPLVPGSTSIPVWCVVVLNISLAATIATEWSRRFFGKMRRTRALGSGLTILPDVKDSLVLGTIFSDKALESEEWVSIDRKALNGNVLVTGSIGSGKTQGTILPYFDQILGCLTPTPAVVAIDPKGTFIKDAMQIAKKHDQASRVLHLRLGGNVLFNPIYVDGVLKEGRFLDVAQMIRAAAINFSGRGPADSPFWELSAFNLTKNALIYVAAVHDYYTLSDLYAAMGDAAEDRLPEKLEEALKAGKFDSEEATNVRHALAYFGQEFRNFEAKLKTGILATATSFLNQFQEFQVSRIFCPPKGERTVTSMDQVVDEGLFVFLDIENPGVARAMGTFIKLLFQQSVLKRLTHESRGKHRAALLIIDEYQDVVSSGHGALIGDDRFLAKGREANAITIVATQSLSSLENSLGRSNAAKELCQNFRTRIACHSTDLLTIRTFQELVGDEDREKRSHSYSELSQDARKNYITGAFEADNANISESVSTSLHREPLVTGKNFSGLGSFEALALVYDGVKTEFTRLNLKPYFLKKRNTSHSELKKMLAGGAAAIALATGPASGFPNVCDVVSQPTSATCMEYQTSACTCGVPPRPCAQFSYYVPETFVEVVGDRNTTHFKGLPGAEAQLDALTSINPPFGTEGGDYAAFQARTLSVPLSSTIFSSLPCSGLFRDATCFGAMSEHLGQNWVTGAADLKQPGFLAWLANPKGCLLLGAAKSALGGESAGVSDGSPMCSLPVEALPFYPPSAHSTCNGWGVFYPRTGVYDGPSQTTAALMVASRMKSLSTEVFQSAPASPDEKWQMILPSASQCFREGQNIGFLESAGLVNDRGRISGRPKDYLFVVWRKVSCCKDLSDVPVAGAVLASMQAACQGKGGLN